MGYRGAVNEALRLEMRRDPAVVLLGVTPDGTCPLDQQLLLPEAWIKGKTRRRNTQMPKYPRTSRTKAKPLL